MLNMTDLYECTICCKTKDRDYRKITSKCAHKAVICLECVNECIKTSIANGSVKITCLTPGCGKLMERNDIKKIASKEIFERFLMSNFFYNTSRTIFV